MLFQHAGGGTISLTYPITLNGHSLTNAGLITGIGEVVFVLGMRDNPTFDRPILDGEGARAPT